MGWIVNKKENYPVLSVIQPPYEKAMEKILGVIISAVSYAACFLILSQ
jgi:hypothetical protein